MFRFLFKWSLQISGTSIVGYNMMSPQKQADFRGAFQSIVSCSRASVILFHSVYDYYRQLSPIEYNTNQYHTKRSQIHMRVANRILDLSILNKGIYLKLGQYLGNLDKVMPWEFIQVLKVLQDSAPPIPYEQLKVIFEEDLNLKPKQIFQSFNKTAIASASLAQVHKAKLGINGKQVAVKIQYPTLRTQSKWDFWVLSHVVDFCNYLLIKNQYKNVDLLSIFKTWAETLVEELDFERQIANAEATRKFFKNHPNLVIPKFYQEYCSERIIVMDYMHGTKVTEVDEIKKMGLNPKQIGKTLISIFADMIFKYGFVHCDAHPGNILIRKKARSTDFQIVLLDHGLYRSFNRQFIKDFSGLWISLIKQDQKQVNKFASKLQIKDHLKYLPIIFLFRTSSSRKKLGDPTTAEEKKYFRENDIANFDSIQKIIHDLPPQLMFVIRATNLISAHNVRLGGSQRERLLLYSKYALAELCGQGIGYSFSLLGLSMRVWIFEHFYWLYKAIFGTLN